jgi:hypothetical protein
MESDEFPAMRVPLVKGDWAAVKVYGQTKQNVSNSSRQSKVLARSVEFMYLARVEDIDDDDDYSYTVSFLKRRSDGSYCWPDKEDISTVDKSDIVKMSRPEEEILSKASRVRDLRMKYVFFQKRHNCSRLVLKIPTNNVC